MSILDRDDAADREYRLLRKVRAANARALSNLSVKLDPPELTCEICLERECVCVGGTE